MTSAGENKTYVLLVDAGVPLQHGSWGLRISVPENKVESISNDLD